MWSSKHVALVIGASRGIGRQVAIDLAANGYIVVVTGKSISDASNVKPFPPDPNSPQSTCSTVAREIHEAGGEATAVAVDVRDFNDIEKMVARTIELYGHIDALIYNSGAIWWASVEKTPMKRFQLMQRVNPEGLYGTIQACLPHFKNQGWKARVIVVSPPIYSRFFRGKAAYAMGKVGMSVLTKGLAMDWIREGKKDMAITSIWPGSAIDSGATRESDKSDLRSPTIYSDAILAMLRAPAADVTGRLEVDDDYLRTDCDVTDFSKYALVPGSSPRRIMPEKLPDLTVKEQDDEGQRIDSSQLGPGRRKARL